MRVLDLVKCSSSSQVLRQRDECSYYAIAATVLPSAVSENYESTILIQYACWNWRGKLLASVAQWVEEVGMSFLGSIFPGDKELGKKDDDHRPGASPMLPGAWHARKQVSGPRRRRIIYTALGLLAFFLFYQNIPTDLGSNSEKRDVRIPQMGSLSQSPHQEAPTDKPAHGAGSSEAEQHYFAGPIKFYKLAASLHAVATLAGRGGKNKNILFAASSLKSAAAIMPMACEMAQHKRNDVHFAFMGREELEIHEIKEINGINDEDCPVHWHGEWSWDSVEKTTCVAYAL